MRLGLTQSTYQYLFSPPQGLFADRSHGYFDAKGFPAPYFLSTPVTIRGGVLEWLINRTADLGLQVCHANLFSQEPEYVANIKALLEKRGIELMPALAIDAFGGESTDLWSGKVVKESIDFAIGQIEFYKNLGGVKVMKFCTYPMIHNRFRNDPPLKEQLDLIIKNTKPIARAAEAAGIVLGMENHLDYRASEVVEVINAINSPNFQFLFDMGNTTVVIEDPVEAAKVAAPYTVLCHLKDVRILPWTPGALYVAAIFAAPLGRGNVDVVKICEIMQDKAPDAKNLCLSLENMPIPPNEDEDLWTVESIKWAKANLAKFL